MSMLNRCFARLGDHAVRQSGILDLMSGPDGMKEILSRLKGKAKIAEDGRTIVDMDGKAIGWIAPAVELGIPEDMTGEYPDEEPIDQQDLVTKLCAGLGYIKDEELIRLIGT